jgi:SAM-dependent methyltransferase
VTRWEGSDVPRGDAYQARFDALAAAGTDVHGEAGFVESLEPRPRSVLDAGCGTGRVAIELHRRGIEVVGVDVDPAMLATARAAAPDLAWVRADLAAHQLGRRFDAVVLAGTVLIFVAPGSEPAVVARCAEHLVVGGALVAGFQLRPGGYDLAALDADASAAGLVLDARYATWDRRPAADGDDYAVSVFRRPG